MNCEIYFCDFLLENEGDPFNKNTLWWICFKEAIWNETNDDDRINFEQKQN